MATLPLILIAVNTLLHLGTLVLISLGFQTSQWAVHWQNCSACDSDCVYFIGLLKMKFTKLGHCGYDMKDTTCDTFGLNQDDCDYYEASIEAAQVALAIVVILTVWKIVVTVLSFKFLEEKTKLIWMGIFLAIIGDIIICFAAFISAGQFAAIEDWNVIYLNTNKPVDFDLGFGWQCFIGAGILSWFIACFGGFTLWRGLKPAAAADSPIVPPLVPNEK